LAIFRSGLRAVLAHLNLFLVYQRFVLLYCPFGLSEQEIDFVISRKGLLGLRKHGWCSHAHQHN
jgi:hypothetical protein